MAVTEANVFWKGGFHSGMLYGRWPVQTGAIESSKPSEPVVGDWKKTGVARGQRIRGGRWRGIIVGLVFESQKKCLLHGKEYDCE